MVDLVMALNVAGPIVGLVVGGLFGRRKTKADAHSVVVSDAVTVAKQANERTDRVNARLDDAVKRIEDLEDRENRRDSLARMHLRWDWRQIRALAEHGIEVDDPPPLFLDDSKGH